MKRPLQHTPARDPEAIQFARDQRATANEFARTVWQWVRNRQICRQKFRREYPLPPYTADFCCVDLKLILEVDGADHFTEAGRERDRVTYGWRPSWVAGASSERWTAATKGGEFLTSRILSGFHSRRLGMGPAVFMSRGKVSLPLFSPCL